MEKAVFISDVSQLGCVGKKYSRVYFGNEFCERLIPSCEDLVKVMLFVRKKGFAFSLVTPYVTDTGLGKIKLLLRRLHKEKMPCEIIVNDWGVLHAVSRQYPSFSPVLGRLLTKQKRCPTLINLFKRETRAMLAKDPENPELRFLVFQKKLPPEVDQYYKSSNVSSVPVIHDFLISRGITRIELDNLGQGLMLELPRGKIAASVYFPYAYISTTFYCLSAGCDEKKQSFLRRKPCRRQCQSYIFKLRHKAMPKVIYLKGNTQFYKNTHLPLRSLADSGVDRIVYEPRIPV